MAMYTAASLSIDRSRGETTEDSESIKTNVKKKCLEQGFAEHDLCPFVSKKDMKNNASHIGGSDIFLI